MERGKPNGPVPLAESRLARHASAGNGNYDRSWSRRLAKTNTGTTTNSHTGKKEKVYTMIGRTTLATLAGLLAVSIAATQVAAEEAANSSPEAISLFDGETLDGWVVKCRPKDNDKRGYWKAVDGTITADVPPGSDHNYIWLLTEREFDDFELTLKVQSYSTSQGNSGIQVRSRYDDQAGWLDGPQVDIHPPGPWRTGFIYDETRGAQVWLWPDVGAPQNARPEHAPQGWQWRQADDPDHPDAWNTMRIVCRRTRIQTFVNGVAVADYDGRGRLDDQAHHRRNVGMRGHIGLQIHPGGSLLLRFKDLQLRPLPKE